MTEVTLKGWLINKTPLQVHHTKGVCADVTLVRFTAHAIFIVDTKSESPVGMLLRKNILAITPLAK